MVLGLVGFGGLSMVGGMRGLLYLRGGVTRLRGPASPQSGRVFSFGFNVWHWFLAFCLIKIIKKKKKTNQAVQSWNYIYTLRITFQKQ